MPMKKLSGRGKTWIMCLLCSGIFWYGLALVLAEVSR